MEFARGLARLVSPIVRAVDSVVGQAVAMRIDAEFRSEAGAKPKQTASLFFHKRLSDSMGHAVAAFVQALLEESAQPGGELKPPSKPILTDFTSWSTAVDSGAVECVVRIWGLCVKLCRGCLRSALPGGGGRGVSGRPRALLAARSNGLWPLRAVEGLVADRQQGEPAGVRPLPGLD